MNHRTMRAAVLSAPGLNNLTVTDLTVTEPAAGQMRLKVMALASTAPSTAR